MKVPPLAQTDRAGQRSLLRQRVAVQAIALVSPLQEPAQVVVVAVSQSRVGDVGQRALPGVVDSEPWAVPQLGQAVCVHWCAL